MEIRALPPAGRRRRRIAGSSQTRRSLGDFESGKGYEGAGMEEGGDALQHTHNTSGCWKGENNGEQNPLPVKARERPV